jgi:hypothetical protein
MSPQNRKVPQTGRQQRATNRSRCQQGRVYAAVPFNLREVSGADVPLSTPRPGEPIQTSQPVRSRVEAYDVMAWWAEATVARHASQHNSQL